MATDKPSGFATPEIMVRGNQAAGTRHVLHDTFQDCRVKYFREKKRARRRDQRFVKNAGGKADNDF
jgi:hypothetical protein